MLSKYNNNVEGFYFFILVRPNFYPSIKNFLRESFISRLADIEVRLYFVSNLDIAKVSREDNF